MLDDPFSLLGIAVWTLAAGMYPLGFMFGVCSACCDDCPDQCNKCSGIYHYDTNWPSVCYDTFDLLTLTSDIDSEAKANVTPSGNNRVNILIDILRRLNCEFVSVPGLFDTLTVTLRAEFLEPDITRDECGCLACTYLQGLMMAVPGYSQQPTSGLCLFNVRFFYDKCTEGSVSVTLTLTREQLEGCLRSSDFSGGFDCEGLPDQLVVTLTYDLDYECECGACCRDGVCSDNESQSYCEDDVLFSFDGAGVWQGVGTDCDPNPCPQPEQEE